MVIIATQDGERALKDIEGWQHLKVIELSVLGLVVLHRGKSIDSVSLFKGVKESRKNPYLSDFVIARVVERMHYRGLIQIKA